MRRNNKNCVTVPEILFFQKQTDLQVCVRSHTLLIVCIHLHHVCLEEMILSLLCLKWFMSSEFLMHENQNHSSQFFLLKSLFSGRIFCWCIWSLPANYDGNNFVHKLTKRWHVRNLQKSVSSLISVFYMRHYFYLMSAPCILKNKTNFSDLPLSAKP